MRNNGIVTLCIGVKSGTNKTVCQLPAGYRPKAGRYYPLTNFTSKTAGIFFISDNGNVQLENSEVGKDVFANVSFPVN